MKVPFNDLRSQIKTLDDELIRVFSEMLLTSDFILGKDVNIFEECFAEFSQNKFCVGVANGSDALRLTLLASELPKGSEVLVASNTYFAAAAAIFHAGLVPVFFDVNVESRFPDLSMVLPKISRNTSAIVKSHLYGFADTNEYGHGLIIVNDCAQAHGTKFRNLHIGSGENSTFSFYPGKNLGALGDAGCITTNSIEFRHKLLMLRNQGTHEEKYLHEILGYNSRLDSLQAKILCVRLAHLKVANMQRVQAALRYNQNFANTSIKLFKNIENVEPTFHLYQVCIESMINTQVKSELLKFDIQTGFHYPLPLHLNPAFNSLGYSKGDFPNSEFLSSHSLSLPMFPGISSSQIDFVSEKLIQIVEKN